MRKLTKYIGLMMTAALALTGYTSCQDDIDAPAIDVPHATLKANTTIADIKAKYWNSADNYIDTIRVAENDEHVVIAGRVISSDASGNIYKSLVIQDATGALAMSINANSLYNEFRIGQEVVIDLTDMYIGKYSTLEQLGYPDYTPSYGWQATFMPLEFFKQHAQLNGLPDPSKIDTLTITYDDLGNGAEVQQKYQSQLVRFNNVYFVDGGVKSFCDGHKINTNRTLKFADGNAADSIIVRTSGYANYWSMKLPAEKGDIVGILSTYKQSGVLIWQLLLRSPDDLLNFGNPTLPKGTKENPYDILEAIESADAGKPVKAWYTGYIVGSVMAGENVITSPDQIIWGTDAELNNTLVIGQTPESKSLDDCMVVVLPTGSDLQTYGNLLDHPENYLQQIWLNATPGTQMGTHALLDNSGSSNEWRINGVNIGGSDGQPVAEGNGAEATPYNPTQVLAMGKSVSETGKWVSGYIVGFVPDKTLSEAVFTVPATNAANILLATTPDEKDYTKCLPIQLPAAQSALRSALNLMDNPGNLNQLCSVYGNLTAYFGVAGVKETSNYKLNGQQGGGDTPQPGDALFSETFKESQGQFVIHNVSIPSDLSYVWKHDASYGYMKASAFANNQSYASDSWLMSPILDLSAAQNPVLVFYHVCNKFPSIDVAKQQVSLAVSVDGGNWQTLNIPTWSTNTNWTFVSSGNIDLSAYVGKKIKLGFHYTSQDGTSGTWEIKNIAINGSGTITATDDSAFPGGGSQGGQDPGPNPPVTGSNTADLNALTAKSSYGTYTTPAGWVATNCNIQSGGDTDSNPTFKFIGGSDVRAVCLNGKVSTPGSLVSPTLSGGLSKLNFNYGFAYTDSKCKFTVNIKKNGTVVQTKTIDLTSITKFEVLSFSWDVSVSGDFVIEIVNDCVGNETSNKERVSIWNISWDN